MIGLLYKLCCSHTSQRIYVPRLLRGSLTPGSSLHMWEINMSTSDREEVLLNGDDIEDVEDEEEDLNPDPCPCLFCEAHQTSANATLDHCATEHGVDLPSIAGQLGRRVCLLHDSHYSDTSHRL